MGTVNFSNIPVLSSLLTLLQTQLGLFGTDVSAPVLHAGTVAGAVKAAKKSRSRPSVRVAGMPGCQADKKGVLADSHIHVLLKPPPARLKVVRRFEPDISPLCVGRMTMSGSMADVCAELDRMVERESLTCRN